MTDLTERPTSEQPSPLAQDEKASAEAATCTEENAQMTIWERLGNIEGGNLRRDVENAGLVKYARGDRALMKLIRNQDGLCEFGRKHDVPPDLIAAFIGAVEELAPDQLADYDTTDKTVDVDVELARAREKQAIAEKERDEMRIRMMQMQQGAYGGEQYSREQLDRIEKKVEGLVPSHSREAHCIAALGCVLLFCVPIVMACLSIVYLFINLLWRIVVAVAGLLGSLLTLCCTHKQRLDSAELILGYMRLCWQNIPCQKVSNSKNLPLLNEELSDYDSMNQKQF